MKKENKRIQESLKKDGKATVEFIKVGYQDIKLTQGTLGMIFEIIAKPENGVSEAIEIKELVKIHKDFETNNGCQWARSDNSYLGKKYIIEREKECGKVKSVKLCGFNESLKTDRYIQEEIREEMKKRRCAILDISNNIEADHKNGRYDAKACNIKDFQPLSKAANDAKRTHCKKCIETGKRYDAKRLGYCCSYIYGDENSDYCKGCYWYDPAEFNRTVSENYKNV